MASRATPFAMFSSCSLGRIGEQTRLVMAPATEARVAVDLDYQLLDSLARQLSAAPQLRAQLRYWTDSRRADFLATRSRVNTAVISSLRDAEVSLPEPGTTTVVVGE